MKKGLFYSFITILLTALCIVSGTTYAYFSNKESISGEINNERIKIDVKLNNLVIKENDIITKPEDLDLVYIKTKI